MEHYRVVVEYVIRSNEKITDAILRQVAARKTMTYDIEVKNVFQVAQRALKRLREDYPKASMTGFTCEIIDEKGEPKHPHARLIRELRREDKAALEDCARSGELFATSVHWSVLDKLGFCQLIQQDIPKHGKIRLTLTPLGREVAAALGYKAGGE